MHLEGENRLVDHLPADCYWRTAPCRWFGRETCQYAQKAYQGASALLIEWMQFEMFVATNPEYN